MRKRTDALLAAGIPAEFHLYRHASHGLRHGRGHGRLGMDGRRYLFLGRTHVREQLGNTFPLGRKTAAEGLALGGVLLS